MVDIAKDLAYPICDAARLKYPGPNKEEISLVESRPMGLLPQLTAE
jgi:hypothetical protein